MTLKSDKFVGGFARGLETIRAFAQYRRPLTIADVSRVTGVSRAAARRMLLTLVELGYVSTQDQTFRLTPKTLQLGHAYQCSDPLAVLSPPIVNRLAEDLKTFCMVSVREGDHTQVLTCARLTHDLPRGVPSPYPGSTVPLYASASGLLFLSQLGASDLQAYFERVALRPLTYKTQTLAQRLLPLIDEARSQGFAVADEVFANGRCSIAVPVRGCDAPVAMVGVYEMEINGLAEALHDVPRLIAAARELETQVAGAMPGALAKA